MKLLQNPLIKFIGVALIIYFALFSNKNNPASLGNRASFTRVKQSFGELQDKGKFIAGNVKAARVYEEKIKEDQQAKTGEQQVSNEPEGQGQQESKVEVQAQQESQEALPEKQHAAVEQPLIDEGIALKDVTLGTGEKSVVCGSHVDIVRITEISAGGTPEKLVIGSKKNWIIEKHIIGMRKGGLRSIVIPRDFKTNDKKLRQILDSKKSDLVYRIVLMNVTDPKSKSGMVCK